MGIDIPLRSRSLGCKVLKVAEITRYSFLQIISLWSSPSLAEMLHTQKVSVVMLEPGEFMLHDKLPTLVSTSGKALTTILVTIPKVL